MARVKSGVASSSRRHRLTGAPAAPARGSYHHGNLRQALIASAQGILEARGVEALTLRAAARAAGVSAAAPYRHFADKERLLAAVAEEGFRALTSAMQNAAATEGDDHIARFRAVGLTYVRFAVRHPAWFRLMFGREAPARLSHPPLNLAAHETFALLISSIEQGQRLGLIRAGEPQDLAVAAWSVVHGLSALLVDGQLSPGTQTIDEFALRALRYLFIGFHRETPPR